jgi:hypothetical protein
LRRNQTSTLLAAIGLRTYSSWRSTNLHEDDAEMFGKVPFVNAPECEDVMKTLQTLSSSASRFRFPKAFVSQELFDTSIHSARMEPWFSRSRDD